MNRVKHVRKTNYRMDHQKGSVSIFMVFVLAGSLVIAALAVDVGYILVAKNELQNVADSAALAAARKMGALYSAKNPYDSDFKQAVVNTAKEVALANSVAGQKVVLNDSDIEVGTWNFETRAFASYSEQPDIASKRCAGFKSAAPAPSAGQVITALCDPLPCAFACSNPNPEPSLQANAVAITVHRDNQTSPIGTLFARIFGKDSVPITAKAVAALSGGKLLLPVGISENWFNTANASDGIIKFHPTKESGAGWHTYTESANAHSLKDILNGIKNLVNGIEKDSYIPPEATAGQEFQFKGGDIASAFDELKDLFDAARVKNDNIYDLDTDPNTWTTNIVVYDDNDTHMTNPHGSMKIIGFARVTVREVSGPPDKEISITGEVHMVDPCIREIPALVQ